MQRIWTGTPIPRRLSDSCPAWGNFSCVTVLLGNSHSGLKKRDNSRMKNPFPFPVKWKWTAVSQLGIFIHEEEEILGRSSSVSPSLIRI